MQIQIQTDKHVQHDPSVVQHVEKTCNAQLAHFASDITRVEVHLRDENGQRGGPADRSCTIEAHLAGLPPLVANDTADNVAAAVTGAARKLRNAIETARGKRQAKATN